MSMSRIERPANLIYWVEDKPPIWINIFMALQHFMLFTITLIFPVVLLREIGGSLEQTIALVCMSMMAGGVGSILQSLKGKYFGSGYLCPSVCGPSYLSASLLALKTGGLSLLFGMLMVSGFAEFLFSRILHKLRILFPPEVTGLIVAMVGLALVKMAVTNFMGIGAGDKVTETGEVLTGVFTLGIIIGLNIWSKGKLKLFCVIVGMLAGYGLAYSLGIMKHIDHSHISQSQIFGFELLKHPGWSFNWFLVIPFVVAMLSSSLKSIGDLTTCQKINDRNWKRTDMGNVKKGILADALSCVTAGMVGGLGQSTSSTNVGLSIATATTSRWIGFTLGAILIFLSFFPPIGLFFAIMPKPVLGATLIFAVSFMVTAGIQIITSRMIDARKTFVLGISLSLGLAVDMLPHVFQDVPAILQPVFSSSLATATLSAILLNLILRVGIARKVTLEVSSTQDVNEEIDHFIEKNGSAWGARKEVMKQVKQVLFELAESLFGFGLANKEYQASVQITYNELHIDVVVHYRGKKLIVPDKRPDPEEIMEDPEALLRLSGYLASEMSGKFQVRSKGDVQQISFRMEH